jgi:hypothetical protein
MAGLESRLKQIETKLRMQTANSMSGPKYIHLLDLPKETVIGAFGVIRDATQGQCILKLDRNESINQDEYVSFD